ncbi:FRG domain-containing protein [Desulfovibrio sp.]|uniref:FRG domain-containing protein n=1 Tax=Desulfovibrio sp. TaxID=885 RepID=UPI003AB8489E
MLIEKVFFEDFIEFYHAMLPYGTLRSKLYGYIFRGEDSHLYNLLPSVLRPKNKNRILSMAKLGLDQEIEREGKQIYIEFLLLKNFYLLSNYHGLRVPSIDEFMFEDQYKLIIDFSKEENWRWIPNKLIELAALAQHYGVPTRLLDWTFDFHIALYFASLGACKNEFEGNNGSGYFVIWALNRNFLLNYKKHSLNFVVPAYSDNPNICAQKGILTYWSVSRKDATLSNFSVNLTPLDKLLSDSIEDEKTNIIYKIHINLKKAREAFMFLNRIGYSASRIFPGYAGVTREMEEKKYIYAPGGLVLE